MVRKNARRPSRPKPPPPPVEPQPPVAPVPPPACRCRNCGAELHGVYCGQCGQEYIEDKRPARKLLRELIRDEFQFNSRIKRTIWPLLFKPGFLTGEYLAGRRARYLPPLRAYLFVSFIMFGLITLAARRAHFDPLGRALSHAEAKQDTVQLTIQTPHDTTEVMVDPSLTREQLGDTVSAALSRDAADTAGRSLTSFERAARDGAIKMIKEPERFLQQLLQRTAQVMFLLLPLFALILKLLYLRRQRLYLEHLIFSLHWHAQAFLMLALWTAGTLSGWAWLQPWLTLFLLAIPVYLIMAMKRNYGQGWRKTLAKFLLLSGGYGVALLSVIVAVIVVSVVWL